MKNGLVHGKFNVSRCMGTYEFKKIEDEDQLRLVGKVNNVGWVINEPEIRIWELSNIDEYIFISSSGLFENLVVHDLFTIINLKIRQFPRIHPNEILQDIYMEHIKRGGLSNVSAILLDTLPLISKQY